MLAAFDQAVADGVDIISLSVGQSEIVPVLYIEDPIAVGAFGAMRKSDLVSCSAGNLGTALQTISNVAPWMMTVAASTLDGSFPGNVKLGDGQTIPGQSLSPGNGSGDNATGLISGIDATSGDVTASGHCLFGLLNPARVRERLFVPARRRKFPC